MLSYTATPRLIVPNTFFQSTFRGFCITTRLDVLAFMFRDSDPSVLDCYASQDNGDNWELRSTVPDITFTQEIANPINFPGDIVCIHGSDGLDHGLIARSTDAGHTWTIQQSFFAWGNEGPPWYKPHKGTTFDRGKAIYICEFYPGETDPINQYIKTENSGASWTAHQLTYPTGNEPSQRLAIAAAADGRLAICGQRLYEPPIGLTDLRIAISDDGGTSWTWSGDMPRPNPSENIFLKDIAFLTRDHIVTVGSHDGGYPVVIPDVYDSIDAGATWTLLDPADIVDSLTGSDGSPLGIVKRITRDAALIGIQSFTNAGNFPVRISDNGGVTYEIIPTAVGAALDDTAQAWGFPVGVRKGRIICGITPGIGGFDFNTIYTLDPQC